jgi:hypothetical protein
MIKRQGKEGMLRSKVHRHQQDDDDHVTSDHRSTPSAPRTTEAEEKVDDVPAKWWCAR